MNNPNDLIADTEAVLEESPQEVPALQETPTYQQAVANPVRQHLATIPQSSAELISQAGEAMVSVYEAPPLPTNASTYQKFGDIPQHLRDSESINIIEVKRLNLAIALDALDRAAQAHENFPSPDAAFAVAGLNDQILKLTKDLEKSQDPQKILEDLVDIVLSKLTEEIVQDLASEMKQLRAETMSMVLVTKQEAYMQAFNTAVTRMGPAMKERLATATTRIARILNVKEKTNDRSGT